MKTLLLSLLVTTLPEFPLNSILNMPVPCGSYAKVSKQLKDKHQEQRILSALTKRGDGLFELWSDKDGEEWTLILHTLTDNEACILGSGRGIDIDSYMEPLNKGKTI